MWRRIARALLRRPLGERPGAVPADALDELAGTVDRAARRRLGRSLSIRHVDAGSCNGCELEIHALNNPYYDLERFGFRFVASPRHADVLLVTGPVTLAMQDALRRTYEATPDPKWVVAAGDCACTGGVFAGSYACVGAVDKVVPVALRIKGCPPTPMQLLEALRALMQPGVGGRTSAVGQQVVAVESAKPAAMPSVVPPMAANAPLPLAQASPPPSAAALLTPAVFAASSSAVLLPPVPAALTAMPARVATPLPAVPEMAASEPIAIPPIPLRETLAGEPAPSETPAVTTQEGAPAESLPRAARQGTAPGAGPPEPRGEAPVNPAEDPSPASAAERPAFPA